MMKARKISALLFAALIIFAAAGCNRNANQPGVTPASPLPGAEPNTAGAGGTEFSTANAPNVSRYESAVDVDSRFGREEFSDQNVTIDISLDRNSYTYNDIVGVNATVTNIGDKTIVYQIGSGSNRVPEGFSATLGDMTPLYNLGLIATADMQYGELMAGESVTFELPYAPYFSANPDAPPLAGQDFDLTIPDFQTEEWNRVEPGESEGHIRFTYLTLEEEQQVAGIFNFDDPTAARTIEGTFRVNLEDADMNQAARNDTVSGEQTSLDEAVSR